MNAPKLELRQGQSLVMTQALQQSIKILQYNSLELKEFIEQALEENPFLLQEENEEIREDKTSDNDENNTPHAADEEYIHNEDTSWNSGDDDDRKNIESDYLRYEQNITGSGDYDGNDFPDIEDNRSDKKSLREHLLEQLNLDVKDGAKRLIGAHLIDLIDDAGYIKEDFTPFCEKFGVTAREIEEVLKILQSFDPPGICARDLKSCLALQLIEKNRLDPAMQKLLDNLQLLADGKFDELQKKCGVDREDLKQMISEIRTLNPKPATLFHHEITRNVEPDIFVRRAQNGDWHVELNMNNFPKISINKRFYKTVSSKTDNKKDKEYLTEQFGTAGFLVRALEQRAGTMLKVTSELVKQQDAFFRLGVRYLKPMTLKDIAAETGFHESTISRVTNGKFLICPRGTFELKYFFTSSLARAVGSGENFSGETVKDMIAELINKESPEKILSDDEIVELLKDRNVNIARRTVAKYREAMNIPSSPKRKRLKQAAL